MLFSDGEKLFAYRLGGFELHWLARPGQLLVASERLTDEAWHSVGQDVLLTLDPDDLEEPHAERLLGDEVVGRADIRKIDKAPHLAAPTAAPPRLSEPAAQHQRRPPSEPPVRAVGQPGVRRGKALHALPAVHATLDDLGATHRTVEPGASSTRPRRPGARPPRARRRSRWAVTGCSGRSPAS